MLTTAIAVLFGQLLIAFAGPHSLHLFTIAAATALLAFLGKFAFGAWPALPTIEPGPLEAENRPLNENFGLIRLFRLAPVTVVSIFQAGITNMNIFVLTPLFAAGIGLSAATTVGLVTTVSMAGMVAQTPIGWLSDRLDRRIILLIQGLLSVVFCAAIAWLGSTSVPLLLLLFFLYGATALTVYPVAIAFANSQLHSRYMVAASGALLLLYSIGNILTPGLAAGLMERTAPQAMLFVLGAGGILIAAAACFNLTKSRFTVVAPATGGEP
jgi:MFS family permease